MAKIIIHDEQNSSGEDLGTRAWFECPGCGHIHAPVIRQGTGPDGYKSVWEFNGSLDSPTFKPSLLVTAGKALTCHSYITDGKIQFLGDCSHPHAGQTMDLPEIDESHWLNNKHKY